MSATTTDAPVLVLMTDEYRHAIAFAIERLRDFAVSTLAYDDRPVRALERMLEAAPSSAAVIAPNVVCPKCAQAVLEDEGLVAGCPACGAGFAVGMPVPNVIVTVKHGSVEATCADGPVRIDVLYRDFWECIDGAGKHDRACTDHDDADVKAYRKRCRAIAKMTEYVH